MTAYLSAFVSIGLTAAAQILLKLGTTAATANPAAAPASLAARLVRTLLSPYVAAGLALYGISTLFWLLAISRLKLSVAYPLVSLSYVLVMIGSFHWLGERITLYQKAGAGLIMAGVLLLTR